MATLRLNRFGAVTFLCYICLRRWRLSLKSVA
nr:MAG TPA: hypothetical protein [Caudoviricetes sp.]